MADENDIQGELIKKEDKQKKTVIVKKTKSSDKKPKIRVVAAVKKPDDIGVSEQEEDDGIIHDEISGFSYNTNEIGTAKSAAAEPQRQHHSAEQPLRHVQPKHHWQSELLH